MIKQGAVNWTLTNNVKEKNVDISNFRREYLRSGLEHGDLLQDPVAQFGLWFDQARKTDITDPNAMVLSTVSKGGSPSQRTVLLKYFDEKGFVFFTNKESRKAYEIAENSKYSFYLAGIRTSDKYCRDSQACFSNRVCQIFYESPS